LEAHIRRRIISGGACKVILDNHDELNSMGWGYCLEDLIRHIVVDHPAIVDEIGRVYDSDDPTEMKLAERLQDALCANQMNQRQQEFMRTYLLEFGA
jgi:hypothetical protein